eukprot:10229934-Ditylum_brightwellii.AAC.1
MMNSPSVSPRSCWMTSSAMIPNQLRSTLASQRVPQIWEGAVAEKAAAIILQGKGQGADERPGAHAVQPK